MKCLDECIEAFFGLIGGSDRLVEISLCGCVHGGGVDEWGDYCRVTPMKGKEGEGGGIWCVRGWVMLRREGRKEERKGWVDVPVGYIVVHQCSSSLVSIKSLRYIDR